MLLKALLGSADKENVLQYILARKKGYASEIASFFGTKSSQIVKQLEALEISGVLVGFQIGKVRLYEFNPRYFFLSELTALLLKAREAYEPELAERLMIAKVAPRRKNKPAFLEPIIKEQTNENS